MQAQRIHLIIVSVTDDYSLSEGFQYNLQTVANNAELIASHTCMELSLYHITGAEVNATNIYKRIDSLQTDYEDVLWFYYAGHGINYAKNRWPSLLIGNQEQNPNLIDIYESLSKKPNRLVLVFGDCCNHYLNDAPEELHQPNIGNENSLLEANYGIDQLELLFRLSKGHIISTASHQGNIAYTSNEAGGLFTNSFTNTFYDLWASTSTHSGGWKSVMSEVSELTRLSAKVMGKKQQSQFFMDIEYCKE